MGPRLGVALRRVVVSAALVASVAALAGGCEALIDGNLDDVACSDEGAVGPPACPSGMQCREGRCAEAALGRKCDADADCEVGDLCLAERCTRTCCTSSDCDPDPRFVCWIPEAGGGSFCRAAEEVGRELGGAGKAWEACEADGDCRSGHCDSKQHRCADTCCADASCAAGHGVCQFGEPAHGGYGPWCAPAVSTLAARYAACTTDADCASGLCLSLGGTMLCSSPCCASPECEMLPNGGPPVACAPMEHEGTVVRACARVLPPGGDLKSLAEACDDDAECRSGVCLDLGAGKACSEVCCSDASCGEADSFQCRPGTFGGSRALRCEPK